MSITYLHIPNFAMPHLQYKTDVNGNKDAFVYEGLLKKHTQTMFMQQKLPILTIVTTEMNLVKFDDFIVLSCSELLTMREKSLLQFINYHIVDFYSIKVAKLNY